MPAPGVSFAARLEFFDGWRPAVDATDDKEVLAAVEERLDSIARRDGGLRMTIPMLYLEGRRR